MMDKLELMHALADGQLSAEEQKQAEALAQSDPECAAELKWATEVKRTVGTKCRIQGDEQVWAASLSRLDAIDRTQKTEKFVSKYAWVFCAAVMVAIFSGAVTNRTIGNQSLSNVQVADLLNPVALGRNNSVDPTTSNVLNLSRYTVIAAADLENEGRNCKYLRLQDQFGNLALLAIEGKVQLDGINEETGYKGVKSGQVNGANTVTWSMGQHTFVLAANRPTAELLDIVQGMVQ